MQNFQLESIKTVAVAGAGTMGADIAFLFSKAGFTTILFDISYEQLEKAEANINKNLNFLISKQKITENEAASVLSRIGYTSDVFSLEADLVIEAVIEKLQVKIDLFQKIADSNEPHTILASNTSSIPITKIASNLPHPERVVGMHFFNPASIMKLVEVISGSATSQNVAKVICELAQKLGKTPVVAADSPGFIVNRVARHFYVESLKIMEENIADANTIDDLMEASGFKMGPFRLMDLIGNDTNFSVTASMYEAFFYHPKFRPSLIQQQKIFAGHLGRKTGKGFYEY